MAPLVLDPSLPHDGIRMEVTRVPGADPTVSTAVRHSNIKKARDFTFVGRGLRGWMSSQQNVYAPGVFVDYEHTHSQDPDAYRPWKQIPTRGALELMNALVLLAS
jgi:hypothetical protein